MPKPDEPITIDVPKMNFLMIDGIGAPESKQFAQSVEALYSVSYTIKSMPKKGLEIPGYYDYVMAPLEGLWWSKDIKTKGFTPDRNKWLWTLMIRQPEFIDRIISFGAIQQIIDKKKNPIAENIKFVEFKEGLSVQIMHIGPYKTEETTVDKLHKFINDNRFELNGKHHEIYISDPRKADPLKMKTVIRYPIRRDLYNHGVSV